jgi:hypothetical protein
MFCTNGRFFISVGIGITLIMIWFLFTRHRATREPYPDIYGPVGPPGVTGPVGPTGPTGPTGSVGKFNTPWNGTRGQYIVVQHRANGNKRAVTVADISVVILDPAHDRREMQLFMLAEMSSNPQNAPLIRLTDRDPTTSLQTDASTDTQFIRFNLQSVYAIARVIVYAQPGSELALTECDLQILDAQQKIVKSLPFPTSIQNRYVFQL